MICSATQVIYNIMIIQSLLAGYGATNNYEFHPYRMSQEYVDLHHVADCTEASYYVVSKIPDTRVSHGYLNCSNTMIKHDFVEYCGFYFDVKKWNNTGYIDSSCSIIKIGDYEWR